MLLSWQHKTSKQQINKSAVSRSCWKKDAKYASFQRREKGQEQLHTLTQSPYINQNSAKTSSPYVQIGSMPSLFCLSYCWRLCEAYTISNCSENIGYMHMDLIYIIISVHTSELNPITTYRWLMRFKDDLHVKV